MRIKPRITGVLLIIVATGLVLAGCAHRPAVRPRGEGLKDNLAAHVQFLTSWELKGRKTRTTGARLARGYIEQQFQSCGLVPWGEANSYELPFGLGKNVIGLLPGADTNFAGEIVLMSAHYDHLGKAGRGRIFSGAADNASGVAVLLETAREMSKPGRRPKRSVAFAAFDGEEQMLLGSFAFSCRPDVERTKITGVVNVDTLGRDFLDTVTNTIIVAGSEGRLGLQTRVRGFGGAAGIRVLPVGSDFIGPRSDHVAFENRGIPCLFFTCGTFKDYHQPGDKAYRLNYEALERSARVILGTVEELGNNDQPPAVAGCDREELASFKAIIAELVRHPEQAGIQAGDAEKMRGVLADIDKLAAAPDYNREARARFLLNASGSLLPYLMPLDDRKPDEKRSEMMKSVATFLEYLYLNYRREWLEGQKQLMSALLKNRPSLLNGLPEFRYEVYDIRDEDISVAQAASGSLALHVISHKMLLQTYNRTRIWPFKEFGVGISGNFETLDCEGSSEQLKDLCLLHLRARSTNAMLAHSMKKVFRAIDGQEPPGGYSEWLKARLDRGGHKSEADWMLSCIASGNVDLMREAIHTAGNVKDPRLSNAIRELIAQPKTQADIRTAALLFTARRPDKATLLALTAVLDDASPVANREYRAQFREGYPLANSVAFMVMRATMDNARTKPVKTIGQTALEQLKKITKKDFGADPVKWRRWILNSRFG